MFKDYKIVQDGDTVKVLATGVTVFSTKLGFDLAESTGRTHMVDAVITNLIKIWNDGLAVDRYLLDEVDCTQDEREVIIEGLYSINIV